MKTRFPKQLADRIVTGPSIEKSIAPLRSFVTEPMRYGRLFVAGDAAHIVPPTGAKGLNLAVSDVFYLHRGLDAHFNRADAPYLETDSATALRRVWRARRLVINKPAARVSRPRGFDTRCNQNEFDHLRILDIAQALAEQYGGLPFEA